MTEVGPGAIPRGGVVTLLRSLGVEDAEIDRAQADGNLVLLAIEHLALGQELVYDVDAAIELTGLPEEELRHIWRSLGFPDPVSGERIFSDVDLTNLAAVAELLHSGAVSPEVAYGMTRVIGSSMARVASALVDAVGARAEGVMRAGGDAEDAVALEPLATEAGAFLPMFPAVLEQVWRRHLQAASRRRLLRSETADGDRAVVGFADLVGFTALAQQVTDEELAEVVDQFERLAYDVVVAGGGRVLKMIGDEVMFIVDDPAAAVEIALGMADASRDAAELSDVRVGLASGPILEREGDAYGATVNLASRATAIAYPGTVVVSPDLRAALEGDPHFSFRAMRPRFLKNIGRVSLSVVQRAEDVPLTIREAIDERRRQMRVVVRDKLAARAGHEPDAVNLPDEEG
ncbi:MAG: adenylate/guanylate cyclase domain-containing protein [Acidimicrobiales bacterium]|nr:adenylate/guanylate cyclase domain-containing protein [Acidimicrobiales bacterium]